MHKAFVPMARYYSLYVNLDWNKRNTILTRDGGNWMNHLSSPPSVFASLANHSLLLKFTNGSWIPGTENSKNEHVGVILKIS